MSSGKAAAGLRLAPVKSKVTSAVEVTTYTSSVACRAVEGDEVSAFESEANLDWLAADLAVFDVALVAVD